MFKSFFKSSVSIEALEAQLEETKRLREAEQKQLEQLTAKQREEEIENHAYQLDTKLDEKTSHSHQEQCQPDSKVKLEDTHFPPSTNTMNIISLTANSDIGPSNVTHAIDIKSPIELQDGGEMTPSEKFVPKSVTSADVVDEYKNHDNEIFDSKSKELTDH